jgi:hypothetical protein
MQAWHRIHSVESTRFPRLWRSRSGVACGVINHGDLEQKAAASWQPPFALGVRHEKTWQLHESWEMYAKYEQCCPGTAVCCSIWPRRHSVPMNHRQLIQPPSG